MTAAPRPLTIVQVATNLDSWGGLEIHLLDLAARLAGVPAQRAALGLAPEDLAVGIIGSARAGSRFPLSLMIDRVEALYRQAVTP